MRAVVTGANRGMGLEFCRQLKTRGADVIGLLTRIDTMTLESSGTFWHSNGDVLPW